MKGGLLMQVCKAYKFRLHPTEAQGIQIAKTLGCCRFVYNHMLDRCIKAYKRLKFCEPTNNYITEREAT